MRLKREDMTTLLSKWGAATVVVFIVGVILLILFSSVSGLSSILGDTYLPKKYMILEKYPVRVIMFGQFVDDKIGDINDTYEGRSKRTRNIIKIIRALDAVKPKDGNFIYDININTNSNFNSRQVRSKDRATKMIDKVIQNNVK